MLEIYIAERFANESKKIRELIIVVLAPRLSLTQKKEVFEYLLQRHHPKYKRKHKREISYLQDLITQRNIFAHWPAEFTSKSLYRFNKFGSITLIRLKNTKITKSKRIGWAIESFIPILKSTDGFQNS